MKEVQFFNARSNSEYTPRVMVPPTTLSKGPAPTAILAHDRETEIQPRFLASNFVRDHCVGSKLHITSKTTVDKMAAGIAEPQEEPE